MNSVLLIIFAVAGTVLLIAGAVFGIPLLSSTGGKIEVSPLEYDIGDVSMAAGLVKKTYEVKNVGKGDLKIDDIGTSCDCTSAVLKIRDKVSPKFSMPGHGVNPVFWSETLKPGEKAELEVIFDPAFHGAGGTGEIVRAVYLSTNDPKNKKVEVILLANVVP